MAEEDVYRALFTGDIHMSNSLPHSRPLEDGVTDRIQDQVKMFQRIKETARETEADALWILGDLFDKRLVDSVTLTVTTEALMDLAPLRIYVMPGNHDAHSYRGARYVPEYLKKIGAKHIHYLSLSDGGKAAEVTPMSWLRFHAIPYGPQDEVQKIIGSTREAYGFGRFVMEILLIHQSIDGCTMGGWTCEDGMDPDEVTKGFTATFSGHFHDHQKFGKDGMYLGAPMQHNFGDAGSSRGFWLMDFIRDASMPGFKAKGGPDIKGHFVSMDDLLPRFWNQKGLEFGEESKKYKAGDFVKLIVEATHAEWLKIQTYVDGACAELETEGIRAIVQHRPVYHHEKRIALPDKGPTEAVIREAGIAKYLEASKLDGLDKKKLISIATEILETAKKARGTR